MLVLVQICSSWARASCKPLPQALQVDPSLSLPVQHPTPGVLLQTGLTRMPPTLMKAVRCCCGKVHLMSSVPASKVTGWPVRRQSRPLHTKETRLLPHPHGSRGLLHVCLEAALGALGPDSVTSQGLRVDAGLCACGHGPAAWLLSAHEASPAGVLINGLLRATAYTQGRIASAALVPTRLHTPDFDLHASSP